MPRKTKQERIAATAVTRRKVEHAEIVARWSFPLNTMAAWAIEMAADKRGLLVREARDADPATKAQIDADAALRFVEMARNAMALARIFRHEPARIWENTEF
jgi:hypothetical protein